MKDRMKQIKSILAAVMLLAMMLSLFLPGMAFAEVETGEVTAPETTGNGTVIEEADRKSVV